MIVDLGGKFTNLCVRIDDRNEYVNVVRLDAETLCDVDHVDIEKNWTAPDDADNTMNACDIATLIKTMKEQKIDLLDERTYDKYSDGVLSDIPICVVDFPRWAAECKIREWSLGALKLVAETQSMYNGTNPLVTAHIDCAPFAVWGTTMLGDVRGLVEGADGKLHPIDIGYDKRRSVYDDTTSVIDTLMKMILHGASEKAEKEKAEKEKAEKEKAEKEKAEKEKAEKEKEEKEKTEKADEKLPPLPKPTQCRVCGTACYPS